MSHKTTVQVDIKDFNTLKGCLDGLGFTYEEAKPGEEMHTSSRWGVREQVDLRLTGYKGKGRNSSLKAIGFKKNSNGTFTATGDFYGLVDAHGKPITADRMRKQIKTRYTIRKVMTEMRKQGYRAVKNKAGVADNGKIKIKFQSTRM